MQIRLTHFPALLSAFASLALAAETSSRCKLVGAIFSIDPLGEMLILKNDRGYLENVHLQSGVAISRLPVTAAAGGIVSIRPADLNMGDLVCVHGGEDTPLQLSVVSRADVHRAQAAFITEWQRNSIYGTLKSIDVSRRNFIVTPLAPSKDIAPVEVSLPESVLLRTASPDARRMGESTTFRLDDLRSDEPVYVRGVRSGDGSQITASLVLKGGYRAILGALVEVKVAQSVLRISEFGTGRMLSMKITPGQVYRTTENLTDPMKVYAATGVVLTPVGLADLQTGDAILIVGMSPDEKSDGAGMFAVTRFGTFGVLPQDSDGRVSWLIGK